METVFSLHIETFFNFMILRCNIWSHFETSRNVYEIVLMQNRGYMNFFKCVMRDCGSDRKCKKMYYCRFGKKDAVRKINNRM